MQLKSSLPLLCYLFSGLYILGCAEATGKGGTASAAGGSSPNPPNQSPRSMSFTDQDLDAGEIAGVVTVIPPLNESEITSYLLYWGKDETTISQNNSSVLAEISKTGNNVSYTLSANTQIPSDTTHLLSFSKNSNGVNTAQNGYVSISDLNGKVTSANFTDYDLDVKQLAGNFTFSAISDQSVLDVGYVLYWGSNATIKLAGESAIATVPANMTKTSYTYTFTENTTIPTGASHLLVYSSNSNGEVDLPKDILIKDFSTNSISMRLSEDMDRDVGQIQSTLTFENTANNSLITSYELYWGADNTTAVDNSSAITTFSSTANFTYTFPQNSLMVGNATYLLLFLKGSFGTHGTPAAIQIADKHRWSYKDIYPQGNTLYRIRYLNNRFVAVGEVGTIIFSSDEGTSWIRHHSQITNATLRDVTFGNNTYIAVGDQGTVMTSTDLYTWTLQTTSVSANLTGITYGSSPTQRNPAFVTVGTNGMILHSQSKGVTWTNYSQPTTQDLHSIAYKEDDLGFDYYIAVGNNGTIVTSRNGTSWNNQSSGTLFDLLDITNSDQGLVVVGTNGVNLKDSSGKGETWTLGTSYGQTLYGVGVDDQLGSFVATSTSGNLATSSSTSGSSWATQPTNESTANIYSFATNHSTRFAVGESGFIYSYHATNSSWTRQAKAITQSLNGVAYGNGTFVSVGVSGDIFVSSTYGSRWSDQTDRNLNTNTLHEVQYLNNTFYAVGESGTILRSEDQGMSWTKSNTGVSGSVNLQDIAFSQNGTFTSTDTLFNFKAVGSQGSTGKIYASTDGKNWSLDTNLTNTPMNAVTYFTTVVGSGVFLAVGDDRTIYYRTKSSNWVSASNTGIPTNTDLYGMTAYNESGNSDRYVVVGDHGAIYTTTDINGSWSNSSINVPQKLNSVMYADGKFVAIGDNGTVFTSTSGTSWTQENQITLQNLHSITFGELEYAGNVTYSSWTAVGTNGTIIQEQQ